ncbi:MAG: lamin tail domain-containing protein, partial [Tepidisphaerales bacterium]
MLEQRMLLTASPIISEVMAGNKSTLADQAGAYPDWLEINNPDPQQSADLTGYSLQYVSAKGNVTTWAFPSMSLGPNQYRVIFCDSASQTDPNGELHTSFNLSKSGASISLLDPGNNVISSYAPYPAMQSGTSYGTGQTVTETKLVSAGDLACYLVPTDGSLGTTWTQTNFSDSSWAQGPTGVGFANRVSGFAVTAYKASVGSINNIAQAQAVISTPSSQTWVQSETASVFNYLNTGGSGEFANDRTVPGMTIGAEVDCYVVQGIASIHIPVAGTYTFDASSDDGCLLTINGQTVCSFDGLRGPGDSLGTITLAAGDYPLTFMYFQNGGGSEGELSAAQGSYTSFNASVFHLVGDTANGGLAVTSLPVTGTGTGTSASFANDVRTDVRAAMQAANNASLYTRMDFSVANPASLTTLTLKMAYDDGYVAWLNGVQVASRNAPASPTWNSTATAARTVDLNVTTFENVDLTPYIGLLTATGNVLAIQAMNISATDGDMLVMPELSQMVLASAGQHVFAVPSPGTPNTIDTWQPDLTFSVQHGFFTQPFQLTLSTTTTGASIYYTLNGSAPSPTNGFLYSGPISITTSTVVRAASSIAGGQTGVVSTETYIFPSAIVNQSNASVEAAGFPSTWGSQPADYAMNPQITTNPVYASQLTQALLSIPTMCLTTSQANLFDPATGIYSNPDNHDMDVPASVEYIPTGGISSSDPGFQINAALDVQGGVGRDPEYEKHSFRIIFKSPYGPSQLTYPLFTDGGSNTFQSLTLRANFNDGYSWGDDRTQFDRVQFADELLLAMGQPAGHSGFVQLYLNGVYWGLYNPIERPDDSFASTYLGGDRSQWDSISAGSPVNSSNPQSWNDLMNFFGTYDVSTTAGFQRLQGNNPDGTPNPSYENLLNIPDYIDYMLMNFYIGNTDWPGHNYYAGRLDTSNSQGFFFFPWDSEMALDCGWSSINTNATGVGSTNNDAAKPYYYLRNNPDFVMMFADAVQKFMLNGGALTPTATTGLYQSLSGFISQAVITESARWGAIPGDVTNGEGGTVPKTQALWVNEQSYLLNTLLPQRTSIVLQQLRSAGLFPSVDAPSFSVNGVPEYGGTFQPNSTLTMSDTLGGTAGTLYYTLDGSDPRLPGGAVSPAAVVYSGALVLTQGVEVKARVLSNGTWSALADAGFYVNLAPSIRITELMYDPPPATQDEINRGYVDTGKGNDDFEFLEITNIGNQTLPLQGLRLANGVDFTFGNISIAPGQYVLVVSDLAAFEIRYPGVNPAIIAGQYTGHLSNGGEEVVLDAPNGGIIQDFTYDNAWFPQTHEGGFSLTVRSPLQDLSLWGSSAGWRASAGPGGSPGTSDTLTTPGSIVINEVLASAATRQNDGIELANTTGQAIDISGWFLSDTSTNLAMYQLPANTTIAANGYLVFMDGANYDNPSDPGCHVPFALSALGGDVYLSSNYAGAPGGYQEHASLSAAPPGISAGLVVKSTGGTDFTLLQTPTLGAANSIAYISPIVMDEIMYHPPAPTATETAAGFTDAESFEFLELCNQSATTQSLSNFFIGDGVGFTFGWNADGVGNEKQTLEAGATATWTASGLSAGTYTVSAHFNLVDANGVRRTKLDDLANYTINYAGGSTTVTVDQNQVSVVGNDVWVNLGSFAFNGPATVTLTRGTGTPGNWTVADAVKFSKTGQPDVTVSNPVLSSLSLQRGMTTLAPGAYVVLVSNYPAFDARYHVAANNIPVAGAYTGHLNNGGEWVRLFQYGTVQSNGFVPAYEVDRVNYKNIAPWPSEPDGNGPALIRAHVAGYGNDVLNWLASNVRGTPGQANIVIDKTAPTIPTSLAAHTTLNPNTITLTWTASSDPQSFVDHYNIYRNGTLLASTTATSYADSTALTTATYSYQISSVNRDGYESLLSTALAAAHPAIVSTSTTDTTHIAILFNEPLNSATALTLSRYVFSGGSLSAVALSLNNTQVTLTTASAMTLGSAYTLTINGLTTASTNQLPASIPVNFTYAPVGQGYILREYWTGISGNAVSDLTSNSAYPNSPSGRVLMTSFEGPVNWAVNYGTRIRGYILPPTTGSYTFWIASDDNSQLWLSTNDNPANKVEIAYVSDWTGSREWTKEASQQSAAISLVAGQRYYIEALQKQGVGGDNIAVRWQLPGGTWENGDSTLPIPGIRLAPYGGLDLTGPTAPANLRATSVTSTQVVLAWDASADPASGVDHYVIYRDGKSYGTATTTSFTDSTGISSTTRHSYQISAVNYGGCEGPKSAVLSAAPVGIASLTSPDNNTVRVAFTEPVSSATAQTLANYVISGGGITISSAHLESDNYTVTLKTSALGSTSRTLTASNIRTAAGTLLSPLTNTIVVTPAGWSVTVYKANWATIGTLAQAQGVIDTPSQQTWTQTETAPWIDYVTSSHFPANVRTVPGTPSTDYVIKATGKVVIPSTGQWSFDVNSDDGFRLTIGTNTFQYDGGRGAADSFATYSLNSGTYDISLLYFQGEGGHNVDVSAMPGNCNNAWNGTFRLIGDTVDGGLAMNSSAFSPAPIAVGVNALSTSDSTPALSGTLSDSTLGVTVRLANTYYAATPATGGIWNLPRGAIKSSLASGTYDVSACASNSSGQVAFDPTVNELLIDWTPPTVSIDPVANPRNTPVGSATIRFSKPVSGFDLADVHLTRSGGSDLITGAEVLSTADHITWTLSGLAPITAVAGTYTLALTALGSGIADAANNFLLTGASNSWVTDLTPPTVVSINRVGATPTNANSLQYTVAFSKSVTGVDATDFALALTGTTGTIGTVAGSGSSYTVTITGVSGNGTLGLNVAGANHIVDLATNTLSGTATGPTYTIDTTRPTVSSINRVSSTPTNASSLQYNVTFSESVTGVDATDFALALSGTTGTIGVVSGSGSNYTVTITGVSGNGTLGLNVAGANHIVDLATNTLSGTGTGQTYTIDTIAPTVVSLTRIGSGASAIVSFSEPVTGVVLAGLTLQRDSATIPWSGVTLMDSGNNNWTLGGLSSLTSAVGQYTLTLSPAGIADLAGNALASGRSTNWLNNALTSSVPGDVITISRNNTNILIT